MLSKIWSKPSKYTASDKKASLLELFFDIIVVVLIGSSVHQFANIFEVAAKNHEDVSFHQLMFTLVQTISVLFIWRSFTLYSSRFEEKTIRHRALTYCLMVFLVFMVIASYIDPVEKENILAAGIINGIGIIGSTFILFYLYVTASLNIRNQYEKKRIKILAIGRLVHIVQTALAMTIYLVFDNTTGYWVSIGQWYFSLIVWMLFDYKSMSNKWQANALEFNQEHIRERYSILFIVFMGESLIQIISQAKETHWNDVDMVVDHMTVLIVTFTMLFIWWWIFREVFSYLDIIRRPKRVFTYSYALIGIFMTMVFSAVGMSLLMHDGKHTDTHVYGKWILYMSMINWHVMQMIVGFTIRFFKKETNFIYPKWFRQMVKSSPLMFPAIAWIPFVPSFDGEVMLFAATIYSFIFLCVIEGAKLWSLNHKENNEAYLERRIEKIRKQEFAWEGEHIFPLIDIDLHKLNKFKVNRFSGIAKEMYEANKK